MKNKGMVIGGDHVADAMKNLEVKMSAIKREYTVLREELKTLPEGRPVIRFKNAGIYYSIKTNGNERGILKESEEFMGCLRREYVTARIADLKESGERIKQAKDRLLNKGRMDFSVRHMLLEPGIPTTGRAGKVLKRFDDARLDIRRISLPKGVFDWINQDCETNGNFPENRQYRTAGGVYVRSKSELFIANLLESKGVSYRYEPMMEINGRQYAPDFVIRLPDGREIIWEHFGLTDDSEYAVRAFEKLQQYTSAGYILGISLIATFESDIRSGSIEEIIDRIVLGCA